MIKIKLQNSIKVVIIDDADFKLVEPYNWLLTNDGNNDYATAYQDRLTKIWMHKLLTGYSKTDHKDGNGLNNTRNNLRECTSSQNQHNRKPNYWKKYKGVKRMSFGSFMARIKLNNKAIHLGSFPTEELAARAYDTKAVELFGEFAKLNFPVNDKQKVGGVICTGLF